MGSYAGGARELEALEESIEPSPRQAGLSRYGRMLQPSQVRGLPPLQQPGCPVMAPKRKRAVVRTPDSGGQSSQEGKAPAGAASPGLSEESDFEQDNPRIGQLSEGEARFLAFAWRESKSQATTKAYDQHWAKVQWY